MKLTTHLALGASLLGALLLGTSCKTGSRTADLGRTGASWIVLFDGKPTDKLRGFKMTHFPTNNWVIEDGALKTVRGKAVDLITTERYDNFDLELEWKVANGGNSGVIYRVAEVGNATYETGPEMQVLDDARHPDGKNPKTSAGSLYALIAPPPGKKLNPAGEWNKARLLIQDNHVEHWLNGEKVAEYVWASPEVKELIKKSKFANMPHFMSQTNGYIALQHHGEEAYYRHLRIRRLD